MEPPAKQMRKESKERSCQYDEEITEKDLPLLANVDEVCVKHYLMKLTPDFTNKTIHCTQILFLEWQNPKLNHLINLGITFNVIPKIILDCHALNIQRVYALKTINTTSQNPDTNDWIPSDSETRKDFYKRNGQDWFEHNDGHEPLKFKVDKWALCIFGMENTSSKVVPSVIRIDYETSSNSPSIHWRDSSEYSYETSADKCIYSPAPQVNNRGLFPCQEPPTAVATWEILIHVDREYIPLLTSDQPGEIIDGDSKTATHYFFTSIPLPMSTFAMVIGKFYLQKSIIDISDSYKSGENTGEDTTTNVCTKHAQFLCRYTNPKVFNQKLLPTRLFSLDKDCIPLLQNEMERLIQFIVTCYVATFNKLGPHPFARLDIVIMPKSFPHMGLANPSMMFLSPGNFVGKEDPLFICRVPHEMCHSWFGLLIGALDWTEEWLSEGFATYYEDIVFQETYSAYFPDKSVDDVLKELALKICLRFVTLQNDLQNTDNELHVMSEESAGSSQAAKNGLVSIKQFMKVHYYKGYLLLWHLTFVVGREKFLDFLKSYVSKYHGELVTSEIFITYFYQYFGESLKDSDILPKDELMKQWLQSNTLPPLYDSLNILEITCVDKLKLLPLFVNVIDNLKDIKNLYTLLQEGSVSAQTLKVLSCSELILLMEHVLQQTDKTILRKCYDQLKSTVLERIHEVNPEVMHRWCELIILCKDKSKISTVEEFLNDNIAMGVYLYGELMITEKRLFQKLAKKLFYKLENVYDLSTLKLLTEMIF